MKTHILVIVYGTVAAFIFLGLFGGIKFLFFYHPQDDFYCVEGYHKGFVTLAGGVHDQNGNMYKNPDVFGCLSNN